MNMLAMIELMRERQEELKAELQQVNARLRVCDAQHKELMELRAAIANEGACLLGYLHTYAPAWVNGGEGEEEWDEEGGAA